MSNNLRIDPKSPNNKKQFLYKKRKQETFLKTKLINKKHILELKWPVEAIFRYIFLIMIILKSIVTAPSNKKRVLWWHGLIHHTFK
jgi:hypothetical protein